MSHFEMKKRAPYKQRTLRILLGWGLLFLMWEVFSSGNPRASNPEAAIRSPSSINRAAISIVKPSKIFYGQDGEEALSPEMIANFNVIRQEEKAYDTSKVIPMEMQPTGDTNLVLSQVADRSISSLLGSDAFRSSRVGQTTTEVEKKLKTEVVVGGAEPKSTQHKFNFSAQAFQASAQILYSGYTNAAVRYKVTERKVGLELFEHFIGNKDLVMSHTITPTNRLSEVSLRWNF